VPTTATDLPLEVIAVVALEVLFLEGAIFDINEASSGGFRDGRTMSVGSGISVKAPKFEVNSSEEFISLNL